jgi:hypothetical protein
MPETPRGGGGTIAVRAARVGRADLGEGTATVDDDAVTIMALAGGAERMLRIPLSAIDTLAMDGDDLVVSVRDGRHVSIASGEIARLRGDISARCFALPELTRTLRAFGSRRGQRGRRPSATADQQRFFTPLVDARRAASKSQSSGDTIAAFESPALIRSLDDVLHRFAVERFGQNAPARRALEAELVDSSEPLYAALRALAERATAATERAEEIRAWRAWSQSLRDAFEAADRVWVALDVVLDQAYVAASRTASAHP